MEDCETLFWFSFQPGGFSSSL